MIIFVGKKGGDRRSWNVTEIARENTRMEGRSVASTEGRRRFDISYRCYTEAASARVVCCVNTGFRLRNVRLVT